MNVREALIQAKANLERLQLAKGHNVLDANGNRLEPVPSSASEAASVCAYGALALVVMPVSDNDVYVEAAGQLAKVCGDTKHLYVSQFNDHPTTTKEDVLALYQDAIDSLPAEVPSEGQVE